jgi:DNA polymerase-3 subunit epsilon
VINLLLIDTETTGTGPDDWAIEVAVCLYHVGTFPGPVASAATLLPCNHNNAYAINKIAPDLTQVDAAQSEGLTYLNALVRRADYLVAFNAEFDRPYVQAALDLMPPTPPWICAYQDFDWFPGWLAKPQSQINLALGMGVGIVRAHRAADDVATLADCLTRLGDRLEAVVNDAIARSQSTAVILIAHVSYDDRHLARAAGFHWDAGNRQWIRKIRMIDLSAPWVQSLPFSYDSTPEF